MNILIWWVLPSLVILLVLLQLRHFDNKQTMSEFFIEGKKDGSLTKFILCVIIWPIGIFALLRFFCVDEFQLKSKIDWLWEE